MPASDKNRKVDTSVAHLQPQAVDVERTVLGALMIDKDAFTVVSETLRPDTFYEPRHQKIYQAVQTLSLDEKPIDVLTVIEQLRRDGALESVGGQSYVMELSSLVASAAHLEYHASILAQKFLARELISLASAMETKALDETVDVDDLMQETEAALFELSQRNMRSNFTSIEPLVGLAIEAMNAASKNKGGLTGLPSGYTKLDGYTAGWQKSDLIILAGRPGMGKTSFALSLAKNLAVDHGKPIAFFSLEMDNIQLVNRLLSNVCEVDGRKILGGQLDADEWKRIDANVERLRKAPIYVDDTPSISVFELRTKARRLVREKKVEMIMIDYLQLMNASGTRFSSRQEEVSTISRSLKGLAKELNIPIIALSQLNRTVEGREGPEGKRPQLSDLRESGAIEQDADLVMFVHRPEYYRITEDESHGSLVGKAYIILAKHRKGGTGDVILDFRKEYTRFDDPESVHRRRPDDGTGEVLGSRMNGGAGEYAPPGQPAPQGEPYGMDDPYMPPDMPFPMPTD